MFEGPESVIGGHYYSRSMLGLVLTVASSLLITPFCYYDAMCHEVLQRGQPCQHSALMTPGLCAK